MASPASIKKHPLHPMLVALPIGLWVFALVCDIVAAAGGTAIWSAVARYCVAGGIVGAVIDAVPGLIDYFSIDEAAMRRIANFHLLVNLGAALLFAINLWLRFSLASGSVVPLILSIVGVICIGVGGWRYAVHQWDLAQSAIQAERPEEARARLDAAPNGCLPSRLAARPLAADGVQAGPVDRADRGAGCLGVRASRPAQAAPAVLPAQVPIQSPPAPRAARSAPPSHRWGHSHHPGKRFLPGAHSMSQRGA